MIIATGLLAFTVTYQAHRQITAAAGRGATAIIDADSAYTALSQADKAVREDFGHGNVALLLGPGTAYRDRITAAGQDLVLTAQNNAAGDQGAGLIQFAEGLLADYDGRVGQAATDAATHGSADVGPLARADVKAARDILYTKVLCGKDRVALCGQNRIWSVIGILRSEQAAARSGLASLWLAPGAVWGLLMAPLLVMLALAACVSRVLRRGFQRVLSARLVAATALTAGLAALMAVLNGVDHCWAVKSSHHALVLNAQVRAYPAGAAAGRALAEATGSGAAYSPWVLAAGLVLTVSAGALAYSSFRPRLEEYRYRP